METKKRVLGEEHPDTLTTMHNLACTYQAMDRWSEAESLEALVVEKSKRVIGESHPHTLINTECLAQIYRNQGRIAEAEALDNAVAARRQNSVSIESNRDSLA